MLQTVPRNLWKPLLVAAAIAFVYAGVLLKLGRFWWDDPNYSHGLLIPFIIGYIIWTERERLSQMQSHPSVVWGALMIACALFMLWAGTAGAELFVQRSSLLLMLAGVAVYFRGFRLLKMLFVPLLLLALAIPIPAIIFNKVAFPLQLFASRCAVWAMRQFDIPVLRDGNVIELMPLNSHVTKKLEVVEACSGIRSLMTLVTLAVVFAYFTTPGVGGDKTNMDAGNADGASRGRWSPARWGLWRALIIVVAAVPIAIVTNAARVSGTGILARYYGTEVADGFFHSFSGWVVYVAAFLLLFAVGWLLDRAVSGKDGGRGGRRGGEKSPATFESAAERQTQGSAAPAAATASASAEARTIGNTPSTAVPISGTDVS
ncbi:MAG TPA: exosortase [Pyrinomonadaceae bacterium]|jgi:exosortase